MRKNISYRKLNKENSRTTNTIFNFTSSVGGQLVTIVMQFVVRTVFINTLGKSYLGINGLFSNILTMLSLAELGMGSAILFKLYEPITQNNHHRIALLMKFYKTVYRFIGIAVMIVGLCLIPFLPIIIRDYDKLGTLHINAVFIFCLYLFKSVSSYLFFAYKSAIVKANQKEYLLNLISYFFTVGLAVVQIIGLIVYPKFEIYVFLSVAEVIIRNMIGAILADKMYPYINEKTDENISRAEFKEIIKDCGALFIQKMNGVVLKATDNIVLSMFLGLDTIAMYSNYYVFYTTLTSLFSKIFDSVSYSLGNLHTTNDMKHEYEVFKSVNLITAIIGGTAGVGIFVCSDELVNVWIGREWILDQPFSLLLGLEVYTLALRLILSRYRTSMGLFQQAKYRPIASMIINLFVSVGLVSYWGVCGVLVGTIVADWTTTMWYDPLVIHKYGFKEEYSVTSYFFRIGKHMLVCIVVAIIDYIICKNIFTGFGWFSIIVHIGICGITVPLALIITSFNKSEGKYVYNIVKRYVNKLMKKR